MRGLMIASAVMTCILGIWLFAFGPNPRAEALIEGQRLYQEGRYMEAVQQLETGGAGSLVLGNAHYRAGQMMAAQAGAMTAQGPEQQGQVSPEMASQHLALYAKALELYESGIREEPHRIDLKFNYEWVKQELEQQSQDQQSEDDSESSEDQESEDESESSEDQQSDGDSESSEDQESEDESESSEDQQSEEDQESGESNQQEGTQDKEDVPSQEEAAVQQILQMLEQQEQESLKNNQEVLVTEGQGDKNDW